LEFNEVVKKFEFQNIVDFDYEFREIFKKPEIMKASLWGGDKRVIRIMP
jgi:hypothetical protein